MDDSTFTVETPEGPWTPVNYDEEEHGWVPLRTALTKSYNLATARLALRVGLKPIIETARVSGITSPLKEVPSLALGAFEVTPLEMTTAYGIFPNKGLTVKPLSIIHVMTQEGKILERKTLEINRVFDPAPVALTTLLLEGVLEEGTGHGVRQLGFRAPAAGKTGTTSNYRDSWFIGFTPTLLTTVWVGFDDNASSEMTGARGALPIWTLFMKQAVGPSDQKFTFPKNIILVEVDPISGKLASTQCPESRKEYFLDGTEPTESCTPRDQKRQETLWGDF